MSTISKARRPVKPERTLRLVRKPGADGEPGLLRIEAGKESFLYELRRLPCDFGIGWRFTKILMRPVADGMWESVPADSYNVLLADDGRDQCECLGHAHRGRCKHLSAIYKLRQLGLI